MIDLFWMRVKRAVEKHGIVRGTWKVVVWYINEHIEIARFFLPKKDVSWLFKILNFISCDKLRLAVAIVAHHIRELREDYRRFTDLEYHTVEEYRGFIKRLGKRLDRIESRMKNLWDL